MRPQGNSQTGVCIPASDRAGQDVPAEGRQGNSVHAFSTGYPRGDRRKMQTDITLEEREAA